MTEIKSVHIVAHESRDSARRAAAELSAFLSERGVEVDGGPPDLVVSLGGDGTMLRAAQLAHGEDAPLLGVNLGTLGYLTEVDAAEADAALGAMFDGRFELEERMMLACEVTDERPETFVGLNEVLVERSGSHRLVRLTVSIGGESLAAFNADGIIVATPTGSTAYALSAGGPIVSPRAQCLVVVPVSPHMIFSRPFVLAPDETVEITVQEPGHEAELTLDGSIGRALTPSSRVVVRRHPRPLRLVRLEGPGFLERLRTKLNLPR
ncbi:MAG: NAD(+)/NADH kinase [Actinomycetota bacterium]|nr:NAD(+)/NADH kinase [Actinomycetota bacterium]